MRHPLLRNSEGRKSYCRAGYAIVFILLLFVLIVEAWKINMSKTRLADFSPEEIEELVGISNALDNMISSRESNKFGRIRMKFALIVRSNWCKNKQPRDSSRGNET